MAWRVAHSLNTLLAQLNALAPKRSKLSDGSIGDTAHQNRSSDHNPWYPPPGGGIVTARDFTHDPAGGLDCHRLADVLANRRDTRIKYIIWNRRILSGRQGPSPWVWRAYSGANPHTQHLHLSVVASSACDSTAPWAGISPAVNPPPAKETDVELTEKLRFQDGREVSVGTALAESWQNSYDTLAAVRAFPELLAAATRDPDLTAEQIAQIVRDNTQSTVTMTEAQVDQLAVKVAGLHDALTVDEVKGAVADVLLHGAQGGGGS
jgi:hypothetical protein